MRWRSIALWSACFAGCGAESTEPPASEPEPVPEGWTELVVADWEMPPGTEQFTCARVTLTEDVLVTAMRALAPVGTHHTAAALGPAVAEDGVYPCTADEDGTDSEIIFASGVGTGDFVLPDGVATLFPAGGQITLNLHLFNLTEFARSGRSGILVRTVEAADERAAFMTAGSEAPVLPPSVEPVEQAIDCPFPADATILDLWPHMHQVGRHMKVEVGADVLHDAPYSFAEQLHYPITRAVQRGEVLRATCQWRNDTGTTVEPGNSSTQEMCILGMWITPASALPDCPGL
jgi:hypothetical protein